MLTNAFPLYCCTMSRSRCSVRTPRFLPAEPQPGVEDVWGYFRAPVSGHSHALEHQLLSFIGFATAGHPRTCNPPWPLGDHDYLHSMEENEQAGEDKEQPPHQLFERLSYLSGYTWDVRHSFRTNLTSVSRVDFLRDGSIGIS